jgi:hypothetical protein
MVQSLRHNIAWNPTAGQGCIISRKHPGSTNNIKDHQLPADVQNNVVFNAAPNAINGAGHYTMLGGDGLMWTTTAPTHLDTNPLFVDSTRNLSTWVRTLIGGTAGTRTDDMNLAFDAWASQWGDAPVAGATIVNAHTWIRAGFVPTNIALKTNAGGSRNGWIGAMEGAARNGGATVFLTSII